VTYQRKTGTGGLSKGVGGPAWSDRPRGLSAPPGLVLLQCAHACFVAS
jgi:hypothetical protein